LNHEEKLWLNEISLNEVVAVDLKQLATAYSNEEVIVVQA
jgi:hypothetical protein